MPLLGGYQDGVATFIRTLTRERHMTTKVNRLNSAVSWSDSTVRSLMNTYASKGAAPGLKPSTSCRGHWTTSSSPAIDNAPITDDA